MKRIIAFLLTLSLCVSLCACGAEKQTVEINYGEKYTVVLKKPQEGIAWETADADIVTVQNGIVTATAPGNALVTGTKDGKVVAEISVSVNLVDIAAILFSQKNIEIEVEETFQQKYTLMPDNASDYGLSWKSANTDIAEVDNNGNIRAIAPGTTTIVCATPNGVIDTCEVVIKEPSAIEQLNEYEKRLFDVMIAKLLPTFYNASAARIRKIEYLTIEEDFDEIMMLLVNIQSTNRFGGTLYKDYMLMCKESVEESTYLPMFTDDGLFDRSKGATINEVTKLDYTKINAALEEYWAGSIHN